MEKSADAFRTISEVADDLSLPQHVLRFWETRFPQIRPLKRAGGRRFYRPVDVALLRTVRALLYDQGYTIKGVQRLLREQGVKGVREGAVPLEIDVADADESGATDQDTGDALDAPLETLSVEDGGLLDLEALRHALAAIDECERILRALRT